MTNITYRQLTLSNEDIILVNNMKLRDEDELEVKALLGDNINIANAIKTSICASTVSYAVFYDNVLCFIFGIVDNPLDVTKASPWMLGTKESLLHVKPLLKFSKLIISSMLEGYELLENVVWEGNTKHIRWLMGTGFIFDHTRDIIMNGSKFNYFYIER
jgi:hypothetical protein